MDTIVEENASDKNSMEFPINQWLLRLALQLL